MRVQGKVHRLYRLFTTGEKIYVESSSGDEFVAQSRHGHDHGRLLGIFFQLLAEATHVHVDRAREGVFTVAPDLLQQDLARESCAGILREVAQQAEFARGERNDFAVAKHRRPFEVDPKRPELEHAVVFGRRRGAAPDVGFNTGQEFEDFKRLGKVVVRADLQAEDFVHQLSAGDYLT